MTELRALTGSRFLRLFHDVSGGMEDATAEEVALAVLNCIAVSAEAEEAAREVIAANRRTIRAGRYE